MKDQKINLHLIDNIKDHIYPGLNIKNYILDRSKSLYPELYKSLDDEVAQDLDELCKTLIDKNWRKIYNKYVLEKDVYFLKKLFILPLGKCLNSLRSKQYSGCINANYSTTDYYPKVNLLEKTIVTEEYSDMYFRIVDKFLKVLDTRQMITDDLKKNYVIDSFGKLLINTWEELKEKDPNCFNWYIEKTVLANYKEVNIITRDQELETLRKWLPNVMM